MTNKRYTDMSGPELLQAMGLDASKWAAAFCQMKEVNGWGLKDIDEGLMTTWFANAIEQARSEVKPGVQ